MTKKEIKNFSESDTEKRYEITPDKNKCFQNKINGHKFIHTNGKQGLPLYVGEKDIDLYEEVNL